MNSKTIKETVARQKERMRQAEQAQPPENSPTVTPEQTHNDAQGKAKKYPHRVSFDMDTEQYKRLKRAAFESDRPMNELLRDAVDKYLSDQVNT